MRIVLAIAFFSLLAPDLARASDAADKRPSWVLQGTTGQHPTFNQGASYESVRRYPSLFATHAAKPWSRTRRRSIRLDTDSHSFRTIHVSQDSSYTGVIDVGFVAHDDGDIEVLPCPHNLTFPDSVSFLYHDCGNQVLHTLFNVAWLMVLFYILGSTASDYFSCTLEKLSDTLKLSPAVAGVTLLAVGNGAPDVFSSVAAFMSSDEAGSIGFSCVLGGALFITTVVSGAVALVTDRDSNMASTPQVNLVCFVRDGLFLLGSSAILYFILLDGKVYLWEALLFFSVYVMYAFSVWAAEMLQNRAKVAASIEGPLLSEVRIEDSSPQSFLMQHHVYHLHNQEFEAELEFLVEHNKGRPVVARFERMLLLIYRHGIEWPLALPRQLTIPVIEEERWSRPFAVASCTLAPSFVCGVWILQADVAEQLAYFGFGMSACLGIVLGTMAFMNTENGKPPSQYLWLWLGGGFFMSIVWFYVVADQVVASLETLGVVFSINPAILGLTVLAWGNCIGDLVADLALACGGRDGVQIAVSGCYAGPLFNMVVGLGLSLIIACWRAGPHPLTVTDEDGTLFVIIGFLISGILWALVVMPLNNMRPTRGFGVGLLLIYFSFLAAGMCYAMGWISR